MAQEALLDPGSARAVLDDLDRHAAQTEDRGLHPAWPLAVTIASDDTFEGAHPEAHTVLTAHTPDGLSAGSPAALLVDEVVSALIGETTSDAWKLAEQNLSGSVGEYAELTYLCRALDDDTWLDQLGPIPVSENSFRERPIPPQVAAALDAALERSRTGGGAQRVLKLVDLLMRAGIKDTDDDRLSRALVEQGPRSSLTRTRVLFWRGGSRTGWAPKRASPRPPRPCAQPDTATATHRSATRCWTGSPTVH